MGARRDVWVKIRASEAERAEWHAKARSAGLTLSDLVRRSVGRVRTWTVAHAEVERERTRQVARIGTNLNQIARWANTYASAAEVVAHLVAIERVLAALTPVRRPDLDANPGLRMRRRPVIGSAPRRGTPFARWHGSRQARSCGPPTARGGTLGSSSSCTCGPARSHGESRRGSFGAQGHPDSPRRLRFRSLRRHLTTDAHAVFGGTLPKSVGAPEPGLRVDVALLGAHLDPAHCLAGVLGSTGPESVGGPEAELRLADTLRMRWPADRVGSLNGPRTSARSGRPLLYRTIRRRIAAQRGPRRSQGERGR